MSRFAQYYVIFHQEDGCRDWEHRREHFARLLEKDDSIEFHDGKEKNPTVFKHQVYHLSTTPGITVMRFANNLDIPIERDFEPTLAKDEPSCFVIIDNRGPVCMIAIQCRRKAFGNTEKVAEILSYNISQRLFKDYGYTCDIAPEYCPADLFTMWERLEEHVKELKFGMTQMSEKEIFKTLNDLQADKPAYYDDSLMGALLQMSAAARESQYYGQITVRPPIRLNRLRVEKSSTYIRNLLTYSNAVDEPVELVTDEGVTYRCYVDSKQVSEKEKIVCHQFNEKYLEYLFKQSRTEGKVTVPEYCQYEEGTLVTLMDGMKHIEEKPNEQDAA